MPARSMKVICYDFAAIIVFFRSVALAVAIQRTTSIEWVAYRDSTALNIAYALMPWKEGPGFAEVNQGTRHQIERMTDDLQLDFLRVWLKRIHEGGPAAGNKYVNTMEHVRDDARKAVSDLFRDARIVNDMVINQTNQVIKDLATVKLTAQIGVAVIGAVVGVSFVVAAAAGAGGAASAGAGVSFIVGNAGASGTAFAGAGLAHSISHSVINNWESGVGAEACEIMWESAKAGVSEGLGTLANSQLAKALAGTTRTEAKLAQLQADIARHSAALARKSTRGAARTSAGAALARKQGMQTTEQAAGQGFARNAGRATLGGMVVPVVFAAWDINDALNDYSQTVGSLHGR